MTRDSRISSLISKLWDISCWMSYHFADPSQRSRRPMPLQRLLMRQSEHCSMTVSITPPIYSVCACDVATGEIDHSSLSHTARHDRPTCAQTSAVHQRKRSPSRLPQAYYRWDRGRPCFKHQSTCFYSIFYRIKNWIKTFWIKIMRT